MYLRYLNSVVLMRGRSQLGSKRAMHSSQMSVTQISTLGLRSCPTHRSAWQRRFTRKIFLPCYSRVGNVFQTPYFLEYVLFGLKWNYFHFINICVPCGRLNKIKFLLLLLVLVLRGSHL